MQSVALLVVEQVLGPGKETTSCIDVMRIDKQDSKRSSNLLPVTVDKYLPLIPYHLHALSASGDVQVWTRPVPRGLSYRSGRVACVRPVQIPLKLCRHSCYASFSPHKPFVKCLSDVGTGPYIGHSVSKMLVRRRPRRSRLSALTLARSRP